MTIRRSYTSLAAVTLILLLAAATRILNIDNAALWTDEGFTYYTFKIDLFDALVSDRHPPFYFYTLHAWVGLAGDSILAMRYWSFLPSLLSIAVAYQIGRELLRHRRDLAARSGALSLPVLAALMLALADGENYLAQELRMYTWHVLFAAGSTLFYLRFIRLRSTVGMQHAASLQTTDLAYPPSLSTGRGFRGGVATIAWILASALLIHTHYFGVYVLAAQGLHALIFLRGQTRIRAVMALAAVGMLFTPWLFGVTLRQFAQDSVCINCPAPDNWERLKEFPSLWFGQMWALMGLLLVLGLIPFTIRPVGTQHAASLPTTSNRRGDLSRPYNRTLSISVLLLLMFVIPIGVTYILGHEEDIFFPHRLSQITLPVTLLLALALAHFRTPARAALVAALVLYGVSMVDWYRVKVPWHDVTQLAADYVEPGELVLAEVGPEESALMYYLDHMLPEGTVISTYPFWGDVDRFTYYEHQLPALITEYTAQQTDPVKSIWLIYFSPDPGMMHKVEAAGYQRTMTRTLEHVNNSVISVYRYDLLPDEPLAAFESGMILRAVEINPQRIDLWWSADAPVEQDFVVSSFLLDASGALVAQDDSQPFNNQRPTRTWQPSEVVYDPRVLGNNTLPPGTYTVGVRVYAFAPDGSIQVYPLVDGELDYVEIGTVEIR